MRGKVVLTTLISALVIIVFMFCLMINSNCTIHQPSNNSYYICVGENLNLRDGEQLQNKIENDGGAGVYMDEIGSVIVFAYSSFDEATKALQNIKNKYTSSFVYGEENVVFSKNICKKIYQNYNIFTTTNTIIENKKLINDYFYKYENEEIGQIDLQKFMINQREKINDCVNGFSDAEIVDDLKLLLLYFDKFLSILPGESNWLVSFKKTCVISHLACHAFLEKIESHFN